MHAAYRRYDRVLLFVCALIASCGVAQAQSLDTSFNAPAFTGDDTFRPAGVWAIAVQSDGKILVGGEFRLVGGTPRTGLARLNADGTLDETFDARADCCVRKVILRNSLLLVAGGFTTIGGAARNGLAKIDGNAIAVGSIGTFAFPGVGGIAAIAAQA